MADRVGYFDWADEFLKAGSLGCGQRGEVQPVDKGAQAKLKEVFYAGLGAADLGFESLKKARSRSPREVSSSAASIGRETLRRAAEATVSVSKRAAVMSREFVEDTDKRGRAAAGNVIRTYEGLVVRGQRLAGRRREPWDSGNVAVSWPSETVGEPADPSPGITAPSKNASRQSRDTARRRPAGSSATKKSASRRPRPQSPNPAGESL